VKLDRVMDGLMLCGAALAIPQREHPISGTSRPVSRHKDARPASRSRSCVRLPQLITTAPHRFQSSFQVLSPSSGAAVALPRLPSTAPAVVDDPKSPPRGIRDHVGEPEEASTTHDDKVHSPTARRGRRGSARRRSQRSKIPPERPVSATRGASMHGGTRRPNRSAYRHKILQKVEAARTDNEDKVKTEAKLKAEGSLPQAGSGLFGPEQFWTQSVMGAKPAPIETPAPGSTMRSIITSGMTIVTGTTTASAGKHPSAKSELSTTPVKAGTLNKVSEGKACEPNAKFPAAKLDTGPRRKFREVDPEEEKEQARLRSRQYALTREGMKAEMDAQAKADKAAKTAKLLQIKELDAARELHRSRVYALNQLLKKAERQKLEEYMKIRAAAEESGELPSAAPPGDDGAADEGADGDSSDGEGGGDGPQAHPVAAALAALPTCSV